MGNSLLRGCTENYRDLCNDDWNPDASRPILQEGRTSGVAGTPIVRRDGSGNGTSCRALMASQKNCKGYGEVEIVNVCGYIPARLANQNLNKTVDRIVEGT